MRGYSGTAWSTRPVQTKRGVVAPAVLLQYPHGNARKRTGLIMLGMIVETTDNSSVISVETSGEYVMHREARIMWVS